jgi:CBS domain-containing protein
MSLREMPVRDVMTTDVVTFAPSDNVQVAMQQLVERGVDAGPVVDDSGAVVGMLSTGDLIVEEARVHFPTVVNFLGVNVTWPFEHKELDDTMAKALGASVGEVMTAEPKTISADASVEDAATVMHDENVSRLPVVDDSGRLAGIIARGDIVKAIVQGVGEGQ